MTDKGRQAGSAGKPAEPAQEQVVIKDKRKIDSSGRAKTSAARPAAAPDDGAPGTPGTGATGSSAPEAAAAATAAEASGTADVAAPEADDEPTGDLGAEAGVVEMDPAAGVIEAEKPKVRSLGAELEALRAERDEHMSDLQRITAEYANYRKRVERDRSLMAEQAVGAVLGSLLPILDDLDRAREHGDLVGPFAAVADQLNAALTKFGLNGFGEVGDPFDPTRHEAVAHQTSADVTEPTCVAVMRRGYLLGERLLRPALVAVADPE